MTSLGPSCAGPAARPLRRSAVTCLDGMPAIVDMVLIGARLSGKSAHITDLVNAVIVLAAFLIGGWFLIRWPFRRFARRSLYQRAPRIRRRAYSRRFRRNHRWRRGW
jgi:hypothetical protein